MGLGALHISRETWEQLDSPVTDDDIRQKLLLNGEWGIHSTHISQDESQPIDIILRHKDIPDEWGVYDVVPHYTWHVQDGVMYYDALERVEIRRYTEGKGWQVCATIV